MGVSRLEGGRCSLRFVFVRCVPDIVFLRLKRQLRDQFRRKGSLLGLGRCSGSFSLFPVGRGASVQILSGRSSCTSQLLILLPLEVQRKWLAVSSYQLNSSRMLRAVVCHQPQKEVEYLVKEQAVCTDSACTGCLGQIDVTDIL